jgi:hypothetical protein
MATFNVFHQRDIDNFVMVYTMGKVGSTAIARSLEGAGIFARHLQWLTPETQAFMESTANPNSIPSAISRLDHRRAYHALRDLDYANSVRVITAIRAPIEQILSHYFHTLEIPAWAGVNHGQSDAAIIVADVLRGVRAFMANPMRTVAELTRELSTESRQSALFCWIVRNYLSWFDEELLPFFPVPILQGAVTDGYQIADNVMIVKFEDLSRGGERAIAAWVQRPQFKLERANVGAKKSYGGVYGEVLRTIRFPVEFIDHLCDSTYVRHFYSAEERDGQTRRWSEKCGQR